MVILELIFGFLLLLAGRELFWLSVGVTGFIIGLQYAALFGFQDGIAGNLLFACGLGLLGAILAITFEWVIVVFFLGFLGGGYLLTNLFPIILPGHDPHTWQIFFIGGSLGSILMLLVFDWALILISSFLGANLLVQSLAIHQNWQGFLLITSMIIGILTQAMVFTHFRESKEQKSDTI